MQRHIIRKTPHLKQSSSRKPPDEKSSADSNLPVPTLSFGAASCAVFLAGILCFANSLDADFVFDDSEAIVNNKDLEPQIPLLDLFNHDFWGSKLASNTSHKSYRPLTVLTFRLNYFLAEGRHPWGFHCVNILLHGTVCVLFLRLFSVFLGDDIKSFSSPKASLLCGLLFAVHPIHTESVAGVVGRADLLCALTFCLSFICYSQAAKGGSGLQSGTSFQWLLLAMFLCAVSVLCKEQGITVLGICSAFDIIQVCKVDIVALLKQRKSPSDLVQGHDKVNESGDKQGVRLKSLVVRHAALFLTGVAILVTRWRIMGSAPPTFQVVDNPHSFVNSSFLRFLNYNYLYSLNGWLLLNPWWLCFDWSMGCVPVIESVNDPRLFAVLLLWSVTGVVVYRALFSVVERERRIVILSLALLVIPFLPASNLFFRVGFVIAERNLYIPSAGFIMLVVYGASVLSRQTSYKKLVQIGVPFLLLVLIARSVHRSNQWRREISLFHSGANVCPLNAKVHYNIAKVLADLGHTDPAIKKYQEAISLHPEYDHAMNNLGNIFKDQKRNLEAEELLERAVKVNPSFAAAWMNLGIVQAALLKNDSAETSYQTALKHRKKYPDCYYNLGNLYLDQGRHGQALGAWRNATMQRPTHISAWTNMIILLDNMGRLDDLKVVVEEALRYNPGEPAILYNYANALGKAGLYEESEKYFKKAIKSTPNDPSFHANIGVLYHRWGKLTLAEEAYKTAIRLDPKSSFALKNLEMLQKKMRKSSR